MVQPPQSQEVSKGKTNDALRSHRRVHSLTISYSSADEIAPSLRMLNPSRALRLRKFSWLLLSKEK
jgi:hypothetical protein